MAATARARPVTRAEAAVRAAEWNALAAALPFASVFTTWEWVDTWWNHFGETYEPCTLFVERGEELLGVLPLAFKKLGWHRDGLGGRVLLYASSLELSPDHLDLIAKPEEASVCLKALVDYLHRTPAAWDVLDLSGLAAGGNLDRLFASGSLSGNRTTLSRAPYLALAGTFDDYLQAFSAKARYNFGRALRQLEAQGFTFVEVQPAEADAFFLDLYALHARRSSAKGVASTFQGESIARFHRELLQRTAGLGWHWNRALRGPNGMVAGIYAYLVAGRIAYYQIAIDPVWERYSPGTALIFGALRDAYASRAAEFDFLRGEEEYKRRWTRDAREVVRWRLFAATPRGLLARFWSSAYGWARRAKHRWHG